MNCIYSTLNSFKQKLLDFKYPRFPHTDSPAFVAAEYLNLNARLRHNIYTSTSTHLEKHILLSSLLRDDFSTFSQQR